MITEFIEIRNTQGIEGLLPQNLPMQLLNEFVEALIELTWDNHKEKNLIGIEKMTVHKHTDILKSIMFLIQCFKGGENSVIKYEEFDQQFNTIRKRYTDELIKRKADPTVENILDPLE